MHPCSACLVHRYWIAFRFGDQLEALAGPSELGIVLKRVDVPNSQLLRAHPDFVVDTTLATTLGAGVNGSRVVVGTVEHLLAALYGMGIDNARIEVDGPEVPVCDGSAARWVALIEGSGHQAARKLEVFWVIKREVCIVEGNKRASLKPGSGGLEVGCRVDFDHRLISPSSFVFVLAERLFAVALHGPELLVSLMMSRSCVRMVSLWGALWTMLW